MNTRGPSAWPLANLAAQRLFELTWDEFIGMPSRLSAEAFERTTVWNVSDGMGRRLG
jgi:hypothetical protein